MVPPGAIEEWEALVPVGAAVAVAHGAHRGRRRARRGARERRARDPGRARRAPRARRRGAVGSSAPRHRRGPRRVGMSTIDQLDDLTDLTRRRLAGRRPPRARRSAGRGSPRRSALAEIETAVTEGGLGLWVVGGEHAFGAGGYAATPARRPAPALVAAHDARVDHGDPRHVGQHGAGRQARPRHRRDRGARAGGSLPTIASR